MAGQFAHRRQALREGQVGEWLRALNWRTQLAHFENFRRILDTKQHKYPRTASGTFFERKKQWDGVGGRLAKILPRVTRHGV